VTDFNPRFKPDLAAIDSLLHSPAGPVVTDARRRSALAVQAARAAAPKRKGLLAASIVATEQVVGNEIFFEVFATVPYAGIVSKGSRPHEIRPRNAQVLRFQVGSTTIYARVVHHPGTKPNPYLVAATIAALQ
jgi:hypothetical protein